MQLGMARVVSIEVAARGGGHPHQDRGMIMKRIAFVLAIVTLAALTCTPSYAQRGRGMSRRGRNMLFTPFGVINERSPEWRMAGGNIEVYQQIMMMKQQQKYQQQYQKQYQKYMQQQKKQMQQQKQYLQNLKKNNPAAYARLEQQYQMQMQAYQEEMKHYMPRPRTIKKPKKKRKSSDKDNEETETAEIKPLEPAAAAAKAEDKAADKK